MSVEYSDKKEGLWFEMTSHLPEGSVTIGFNAKLTPKYLDDYRPDSRTGNLLKRDTNDKVIRQLVFYLSEPASLVVGHMKTDFPHVCDWRTSTFHYKGTTLVSFIRRKEDGYAVDVYLCGKDSSKFAQKILRRLGKFKRARFEIGNIKPEYY